MAVVFGAVAAQGKARPRRWQASCLCREACDAAGFRAIEGRQQFRRDHGGDHRRTLVLRRAAADRQDKPVGEAGIGTLALQPVCRSEEHTSELQSLMRISYAVFCLNKKKTKT